MSNDIKLFFCGDVMLGRGIDAIQEFSCNAEDSHDLYVELAERKNGPIPSVSERPFGYIWGDALNVLEEKKPDLRIINLETSVTTSKTAFPNKTIHYKMHPNNVNLLKLAKIDCCVLSNNHTVDWGFSGLKETLDTLNYACLSYAGAGYNVYQAEVPCVLDVERKGRVLVFGLGHPSSGIPKEWQATSDRCGISMFDTNKKSIKKLAEVIKSHKKDSDIVVLSIHWGSNWSYDINPAFQDFSHKLIDSGLVDMIHGHSSHHVKAMEVYNNKLILYGCGDFINDYEGISGHKEYRGNLSLMYFVCLDPETKNITQVSMVPTRTCKLQVKRLTLESDYDWLYSTLKEQCQKFGCDVISNDQEYFLKW